MTPVFGREIIECQQNVSVFGRAVCSFGILALVGIYEDIKVSVGLLFSRDHPDLLETAFGLALKAFGKFVQRVCRLMGLASLHSGFSVDLMVRIPETQRTTP